MAALQRKRTQKKKADNQAQDKEVRRCETCSTKYENGRMNFRDYIKLGEWGRVLFFVDSLCYFDTNAQDVGKIYVSFRKYTIFIEEL